jgi:hypothetical protein
MKSNSFSKAMESVFNNNSDEKQSSQSKKGSLTNGTSNFCAPSEITQSSRAPKLLSNSVSKIVKRRNQNDIFYYITKIRISKSVEDKQINKLFVMEEFFDCDCCSHFDINYSSNDYELQLVKKSEDIRKSYITKLIYNKVWEPINKPKHHNTLIIFDWDDTLLCTTFLTPNGVFNENTRFSEKELEKISKLEENVIKVLKFAIAKGDTYIITNAAPGWVEYSTKRFYPKVSPLLSSVKIVSARGKFEKEYPNDSRMWKIQAFLEMEKNFNHDLVTNIICLGDSVIEMEAGQIIASKFSQAYIKTIKFKEAPKPEELIKQLLLVVDQFNSIYSSVKNLTIRVERKSKKEK